MLKSRCNSLDRGAFILSDMLVVFWRIIHRSRELHTDPSSCIDDILSAHSVQLNFAA